METYAGHTVKDFMIGKTRIRICDDAYRDKSEEEILRLRQHTTRVALRILRELAEKEA